MGKFAKILIFAALLNSIKMDDFYEYDVQLELKSVLVKVESLSIEVQKLQRKQNVLQNRLKNVHTDGSDECCREISEKINEHDINQKMQNISRDSKNENYFSIKKAFYLEKKHLRNMIQSWEQKVEGFLDKYPDEKSVEIEEIDEKIAQQASKTSNLSLQLQLLNETVEDKTSLNEERINTIETKLGAIEAKSDGFEKRIGSINSSISSLILSSERKVSFSVQYKPKDGSVATLYRKETGIKFKMVVYNDGNGYNETTGIFTVPMTGVYQFIFFVEGWHQGDKFTCQDAVVALYVDGKPEAAAVADPRHDKQFATGGNTYISFFSKGQRVQIGTAKTCEQYIIFGYRTTFSGHLLY